MDLLGFTGTDGVAFTAALVMFSMRPMVRQLGEKEAMGGLGVKFSQLLDSGCPGIPDEIRRPSEAPMWDESESTGTLTPSGPVSLN